MTEEEIVNISTWEICSTKASFSRNQ